MWYRRLQFAECLGWTIGKLKCQYYDLFFIFVRGIVAKKTIAGAHDAKAVPVPIVNDQIIFRGTTRNY